MDDARDDSRLGMPSILDAALAPELAEPFSLTASFSSLPLPFPFKALVERERVRRVGILEGFPLFRFEPLGAALADVVFLLSNDVPERKIRAFRRDVSAWAFEERCAGVLVFSNRRESSCAVGLHSTVSRRVNVEEKKLAYGLCEHVLPTTLAGAQVFPLRLVWNWALRHCHCP